mgnify:CR=1 FL=1
MSVDEQNVDTNPEESMEDHEVLNAEVEQDVQPETNESADATPEGEKDWQKEATLLQEQIVTLKDQALRATADAQNIRRRSGLDVEKAHKFALEKFTKELLPVVDSLEKALENSADDDEGAAVLREGVEMTLTLLTSGLKKFNVNQIDPVGEPFDPAHHEAVSMIDAPDAEPNSVIVVIQKGYTLNDRLVRPAMVMVAKASPIIDAKA